MIARNDRAASELLLVDIGNTRVAMARSSEGRRGDVRHVASRPAAAVAVALSSEWEAMGPGSRAVVIGSVAPQVLEELRTACQQRQIEPLLVVGEDLDPPIGADVDNPDEVGADRLCTAAAAFARMGSACVVADFGTALTIDLVSDNGVYLGGTIMPGIALSARALHEHTALLPLVEIGTPTKTLGKNTQDAIRNGVFAMMIGALREVTERYATQIGKWPPLIVTGGNAEEIAKQAEFVDRVAPDLCLDGIAIAYQSHVSSQSID